MPSSLRQARRRIGIQKNAMQASAVPPAEYKRPRGFTGGSFAAAVAGVVVMTNVAVPFPVPVSETWFEGLQVNVGGCVAFVQRIAQ